MGPTAMHPRLVSYRIGSASGKQAGGRWRATLKGFQRQIEDFDCLHCGAQVAGTGYTNHCPRCLWSQHVDVNPGDRQAACEGMMVPVGVERKRGAFVLIHRCVLCGFERKNKAAESDDPEAILEIARQAATNG